MDLAQGETFDGVGLMASRDAIFEIIGWEKVHADSSIPAAKDEAASAKARKQTQPTGRVDSNYEDDGMSRLCHSRG